MSRDNKNNSGKFNPLESLADLRHEFGEHGGVNMSIETSTTFTVMQADELPKLFQGKLGPDAGGYYLYGRHFNPTVYVLGRQLAALENTEAGYCTASGMGAISSVIIQLCEPGDHIVASNTLYGGTFALFNEFLPRKNAINTSFVRITDLKSVEAAITDRTKVLYVESLSNPTLVVADIPRLAEIAHRHNVKLIVDNTFSPLILTPANLGADIVIHSLTKFINGASDIIAGAVCGDQELIYSMMDLHQGTLMLLGPTMDPQAAFSISLRLPHLGMRMAEHSRRALIFSQRLEELKLPVIYPGLTSHPQHEILKGMVNDGFGYGGILALDLGSAARANKFMELLQNQDRFGYIAVSLGYFDTLISCSSSSTSCELSEEAQSQAGISPGLVRFSLGYTGSLEQRWRQLTDALNCLEEI
jgi:methionine-gamma-lyase